MPRPTTVLRPFLRVVAGATLLFVCLHITIVSGVRAQPSPSKSPSLQPKAGAVAVLESRWQATPAIKPSSPILLFDSNGQNLVVTGRLKIEAVSFDARTGKQGFQLATPPDAKGSNFRQIPLEKGVVLFQQGSSLARDLISWDTRSGNIARVPFQTVGRGLHWLNLSPNGRYMSVSTKKRAKTGEVEETPLRVFDQATGKAVVSMDWLSGATAFTADSSRILTVDATDRFQWFRIPAGTPDGEWKFDRKPVERPIRIVGLSADGGAILYSGAPPNKPFGVHLLNGKTGEVLLSFSNQQYFQDVGFISPDGNSIVLVRRDPTGKESTVELLDSRGALLARLGLPPSTQPFLLPGLAVSWEARALAVYHFDTNKLEVFNLPGAPVSLVSRMPRDAAFKTRSPIPADAAIVKAEESIRQLLKDEFARKQPSERKALAQKLIKLAAETPDDPASRYVMLREAQDLAVGLVDPALALQVIEQLAKGYDIEGAAQQLGALEKILAGSSTLPPVKFIIDFTGPAAETAMDADAFDDAVQFAQLAFNALRKAKLATGEAEYRLNQAKKAREAFAAIRPSLEILSQKPSDPAANSNVGRYRCFVQNRWEEGLKHLAMCQDPVLRAVAELDLNTPRSGVPDPKIAEAWSDYAKNAPAYDQWSAQSRARYWYTRCLPGLTGLNKLNAEKRLAFTSGGTEYRPGLFCELTAKQVSVLKGKKARIDPVVDFSGSEFAEPKKTTDLTLKWTGALVPPQAGRYRLSASTGGAVRIRVEGKVVIDTTLPKASRKEALVPLGERATPIVIEFFCQNTDRHKLQLQWALPGRSEQQPIAAEYLFHDKKLDAVLGK